MSPGTSSPARNAHMGAHATAPPSAGPSMQAPTVQPVQPPPLPFRLCSRFSLLALLFACAALLTLLSFVSHPRIERQQQRKHIVLDSRRFGAPGHGTRNASAAQVAQSNQTVTPPANATPSQNSTQAAALGPGFDDEDMQGYSEEVLALVKPTPRAEVPPSEYQLPDDLPSPRNEVRQAIRAHVASEAYAARVRRIAEANLTGIVIPAGGARLATNMLVTLKVLREHFRCDLPIEVMWRGRGEMDQTTWSNIAATFAPIRGVDILSTPHPVPGMHIQNLPLQQGYTGKVYSLLLSEFRHVLMVDADSMPTQNPVHFFSHPLYKATGNLFWPDAWQGLVRDAAYSMFGLDPQRTVEVLHQGKGFLPSDTESGQMLLDRAQHLDVLEYVLWVNSDPGALQGIMWGDKDTFGVAFAAAGKAHLFNQVPVPPAGIFNWRPNMLLEKATQEKSWGWQLLGFLQHDSWGQPAFIHRTINKYNPKEKPWPLQLITAPMPARWSQYFLAHENVGPTRGVPWDFVVPGNSVTELTPELNSPQARWVRIDNGQPALDPPFPHANASHAPSFPNASAFPSAAQCPEPDVFLRLWAMKESGLPVDLGRSQQRRCLPFLRDVLGAQYEQYRASGWLLMPSMRYLDGAHMSAQPDDWAHELVATPLPAWRPDFSKASGANGPFARVVRAAYSACDWALSNRALFPLLNQDRKRSR